VIFDMDGLLIDSEPYWRKAEQETFRKVGVIIDDEMVKESYGLATDEVIRHWYNYRPWPDPDHAGLKAELYDRVYELFMNGNCILMDGAREAVETVLANGLKAAIASSSPRLMIDAFLDKTGLRDRFTVSHTSEDEAYGKPNPAVYLGVASRLGVPPYRCLALEDSFNGMIAAKAARMKTVVVPEEGYFDDPRYVIADGKLRSLKELSYDLIRSF
jgi:HAD superfamily hydrolase (TIGR01509 family)